MITQDLIRLCDAMLNGAAGVPIKAQWQALRNKASGQYAFGDIFDGMFRK